MRRVVITGIGMVTPLGIGVKHNWESLLSGKSGIKKIEHFPAEDIASQIAGIIPKTESESPENGEFNPNLYMPPKDQRKTDPFVVYGMAAASEAIEDSGWKPNNDEDKERTGVLVGSGIGGLLDIYNTSVTLYEKGPRKLSPFSVPAMLINMASGHISMRYDLRGPNHSVVTACASGTHAIGDAFRIIALGEADVMIAGGAEAGVNRMGVSCFVAARALSTSYNDRPEYASRPFDKGRDGFVIAEGSGILVMEEYEHAKKRGAKIYGEIIGYGMSGDAYHITSPHPEGAGGYRAMKAALKRANIDTTQIDYINAHGTSTPAGDGIECKAVKNLFGENASHLSMSSTKSSIGHLLGAAGAVEAIYTLKAMENGIIPATLNLDDISEECSGIDLVPNTPKEKQVNIAISNSFGFGGTNASIVMRKM